MRTLPGVTGSATAKFAPRSAAAANTAFTFLRVPGCKKQKAPLKGGFRDLSGQRAYLPDPHGPSTSAAEELNCRVRDGNGCFLLAMVTRKSVRPCKRLESC